MLFTPVLMGTVALPSLVCAQDITAGINGQVTDDNGKALSNARITVVHTPSGTRSTATADRTGQYSLRGLRVGGPYTVTVDAQGFQPETVEGVSLNIGESFNLPLQLANRVITVTANRAKGSRNLVTGSQTTFNNAAIQTVTSAKRDVRDIIRRDILANYDGYSGGVSVAGANIRTQRFSINGIQAQDAFGLNYGGLPSSRGIVSIEMIDQLTVKVAPFDISEGNFQGGAVDVVLKSGTNKLHVTAFGDLGGRALTGKYLSPNSYPTQNDYATQAVQPAGAPQILDFRNYGGSITGPIIPNKLFFSVGYEHLTEGTPNPWGIAGTGAANTVNLIGQNDQSVTGAFGLTKTPGYTNPFTISGVSTILSIDKSVYQPIDGNFDPGIIPTAISEVDEKYSGQLDWNITDNQRAKISYIHHKNTLPSFVGGGLTGIGFQSYDYQLSENNDLYTGQLNSKWSNELSSELRIAYKKYRRGQDSYNGVNHSTFQICDNPVDAIVTTGTNVGTTLGVACTPLISGLPATPVLDLGPDGPRQANKFNQHILTLQGNLQYRIGNHTLKLEGDHSYNKLYNLFVFQQGSGPTGVYYFDSVADFQNRTANSLSYAAAAPGLPSNTAIDPTSAAVNWAYATNTIGLQDTWKVQPNLTVTGGFRYDIWYSTYGILQNPYFNNANGETYGSGATAVTLAPRGYDNTSTLDGRKSFQPRLGFNWQAKDNLRLVGGIGLFAGGLSDVFVSNNYSNNGVSILSTSIIRVPVSAQYPTGYRDLVTNADPGLAADGTSVGADALNNVVGKGVASQVQTYLAKNASVLANSGTNELDPKFKIPAQWKYNLSLNWKPDLTNIGLGTDWNVRADVVFSDAQNAVLWTDVRATPLVINGVTQFAPDGRPRYNANVGGNADILLTNTKKGQSRTYAIGVAKDLGNGLGFNVSYAHQNVKDVAGAIVSSTTGSTYGIPSADPNVGAYGRSQFEVTDSAKFGVTYRRKFFGDNETTFALNAEVRSGNPYSITFSDSQSGRSPVFGTTNNGNYLIYVPNFNLTPTVTTAAGGANYIPGVAAGLTVIGNVVFSDANTLNNLQALVQNTKLARYQGQIAPKDLLTGPAFKKMDLHLSQQVPFFHHSHFTALLDIENFLNLINKDWNTYQYYSPSSSVVRVTCAGVANASVATSACPYYQYSNYSAPVTTTVTKASLYAIRLGLRFDF